jgi:tetratricopeptide (TPR) repeat protein
MPFAVHSGDVSLRLARACLSLLGRWEQQAARRGAGLSETELATVLREVDLNWPNVQKSHQWCAARASAWEEADRLCQDFATAAPDLLALRLPPADLRSWLEPGLNSALRFGNDEARMKIIEAMGQAYLREGNLSPARSCFEEQHHLAEILAERRSLGKAVCHLANVEAVLAAYEKAEPLFHHSLQIAIEISDDQLQADVLGNLAILYDDSGRPQEATDTFTKALKIVRRIGDRAGEVRHLGNLAGLLKNTGESVRALGYYKEQLGIVRDLKDRRIEASALQNIGLIYLDADELEEAISAFEESLTLRRRLGDRRREARALGALGIAFRKQGNLSAAVEHLSQWLRMAQGSGDRLEEAEALTNLGNTCEDLEIARDYYERALVITRDLVHPRGLGIVLKNLGRVYFELGDLEKAETLDREALELHRQAGNRYGQALSLAHLAKVRYRLGDPSGAVDFGGQAVISYIGLNLWEGARGMLKIMEGWAMELGDEELQREIAADIARIPEPE